MVTIVDYKAGNQTSVKRALDHLGIKNQISANPNVILSSDHIIFPGVGHAGAAMDVLRERGLDIAMHQAFSAGIPILGICIGCQIILDRSEESDTDCLGLLSGVAKRFVLTQNSTESSLKIPHMGWNNISITAEHPVLHGFTTGEDFYFVHSYYPMPTDTNNVFAECEYGLQFPVAIGSKNLFAVQFHAEKSGKAGLRLIENFSTWKPT